MAQIESWSHTVGAGYQEEDTLVKDWLRGVEKLQLGGKPLNGTVEHDERDCPATPVRKTAPDNNHAEVSPTDTNFSGSTLFDNDYRLENGSVTPCPLRLIKDDDCFSDVTTIDVDINDILPKNDANATIVDQEPILNNNEDNTLPTTHLRKRMVNIVSCLQCTLSNLPCSRTLPTCHRCTRNHTPHCLSYRRAFPSEVLSGQSNTSVLLRIDLDDDAAWGEKLVMVDELRRIWQDDQDRKNWVLPAVDVEVRGGWRRRGIGIGICGKGEVHPGEGLGRMAVLEMEVEEYVRPV